MFFLSVGNVYEMRREKDPAITRDICWATQTCVLGYCTAGAWTHLTDEEDDLNTVCKSNYEDYLAVGDNQGSVRLFKYPASTTKVLVLCTSTRYPRPKKLSLLDDQLSYSRNAAQIKANRGF